MDEKLRSAIMEKSRTEPFARTLKMEVAELTPELSVVEMDHDPAVMDNLYGRAHGGAVFGLVDEAFETISQMSGTIHVALNVNITYVASPEPGARLRAEARLISRTKKTAGYSITVKEKDGKTLATCQALAFNTGKPIPFAEE